VVFTIKAIQNPLYKSPLRANWQGVEVEKIDDYNVRFSLRSPYAPFIENLTVGIMPRHLWAAIPPEQALLHELNLQPTGSGPYVFQSLKQDREGSITRYLVKRNSNYYLEGPFLKKIEFIFFRTEEEMVLAWQKGKINSLGPFPLSHSLDTYSNARLISITMPRIFGLFFNQKKNDILADLKIRQALAQAIDKKEIASAIPSSRAIAVDSALPPGSPGYTKDLAVYPFDPEKSKELLTAAGWKDLDGDGIREKSIRRGGKTEIVPLRLTVTTSDWPDLLKTAALVKAMLKPVGVELVVDKYSFAELEAAVIRPRNFEVLLFGQVYGFEPDPFAFWHSSQVKDPGLNVSLYASKKADEALELARRTSAAEKRATQYIELQKAIAKDLPAIFLYSQIYLYVLPENLKGVDIQKISLPADRFNELHKWYKDTKRVWK
jgi:peptide/nickel transport system substrate-binding protein